MSHCRPYSGTFTGEAGPSGRIPPRSEIPQEYTWNLEAVFPSADEWEESFLLLGGEMERLGGYCGRLFESPETLLEFLKLEEAASERLGKLYAYAVMKSHEDTADAARQARADRAGTLLAAYGAALSFYRPEVLAAGQEKVNGAIEGCSALGKYRHHFDDLLRTAGHVLGLQEEEILARSGEIARTPENAFSLLTNADLTFPVILDEAGRETELSEERYYLLSRSKDRRVRKDAFEGLFTTYGKYRNTLAALYSGSVKSDLFYSRARKYPSALEASLHEIGRAHV